MYRKVEFENELIFFFITRKAPPITARHSWSLTKVVNSHITGEPSLQVHGSALVNGGGLEFDSRSVWLGTHINAQECLVNPDNCQYGFSFGSKLKFDGSVRSYTSPKYVVDTGAMSAKKCGVSVYVLSGNLHILLATKQKSWTVSMFFILSSSASYFHVYLNALISLKF